MVQRDSTVSSRVMSLPTVQYILIRVYVQYTEYLVNIFKILNILKLTVHIDRFHFGSLHSIMHQIF